MQARSPGAGLWFALASAATFATSGPFAKSLLHEGWSSGAVVLLRVAGAALALSVPTVLALRGRWGMIPRNLGAVLAYGAVAVAGCQVSYFYAVQRLDVGVALLLEYLGIVLVVLLVWLRTRRATTMDPRSALGVRARPSLNVNHVLRRLAFRMSCLRLIGNVRLLVICSASLERRHRHRNANARAAI